ncbi:biotin carboxylase N-terminal domain-containing protein [Enterovirga sp.]|uniref:acetyl/propionyl/methylcrotonyl-CoA carboxylase subunit alpha n=1 Tax=Enterovirga sp. TaxID=2026350 RepID=UPI002B6861FB|nr:biotin carboxylase N-terminal domain-containing protein [Enterovirga sp.]HMO30679.1 biotin carboxylase N-terminal domain-containing protein [Enterovirga sp.]
MKKVLIANRGEIALRVVRACRDYGLASVAVYADADADAPFVRAADEAWGLCGARPAETYLDIGKLIAVARRSGADAVHPGYGFLSERAEFARAVQEAGLTWIGPDPHVIEALGDKVEARRIAEKVGAPLVAGSDGPIASGAEAEAFARAAGLPIAIKAAFGGGGRGMKVAWKLEEVAELYDSAVREATTAFGRGDCYVERFLDRPRHVEAQVVADRHGNVVVAGTRDCSLQRRNQKLVEEAPAPFLTDDQRARVHAAARDICAAAGYTGAGTVEFLLSADGVLSFLEVNTRLQVEHPVTEETAGVDLVIEQFRIAEGLPLSFTATPEPRGHSIEFRINAEDPGRGFLPAPGAITLFAPPSGPGVRVDAGVETGGAVAPAFDSLMGKLIVTGPTREAALARARRALAEFRIEGVPTVLPFHRAVLEEPAFTAQEGFRVHTRWIETEFGSLFEPASTSAAAPADEMLSLPVEIDGRRVELRLPARLLGGFQAAGAVPGQASPAERPEEAGPGAVRAPVPGTIQLWRIEDGAEVNEGDIVAVMEAMKMETPVFAPLSGQLRRIAAAGSMHVLGAVIARIEA